MSPGVEESPPDQLRGGTRALCGRGGMPRHQAREWWPPAEEFFYGCRRDTSLDGRKLVLVRGPMGRMCFFVLTAAAPNDQSLASVNASQAFVAKKLEEMQRVQEEIKTCSSGFAHSVGDVIGLVALRGWGAILFGCVCFVGYPFWGRLEGNQKGTTCFGPPQKG